MTSHRQAVMMRQSSKFDTVYIKRFSRRKARFVHTAMWPFCQITLTSCYYYNDLITGTVAVSWHNTQTDHNLASFI